jgi:RHS repeat-associated protein
METYGTTLDYGYSAGRISDITDLLNPGASQHFDYDLWGRLTSYWQSVNGSRYYYEGPKLQFSYDLYNNIMGVGSFTFTVDAATNRLLSRTSWSGTQTFTYDAAGNMTSMGTFDAENRLTLTSQGASYMYDGNGRRFRTNDGNVVYYVYSFAGQLLTENRITESTSNNYIYFNGQLTAIHQQNDNFRLLFKDHLGSTRKVLTVPIWYGNWQYAWSCTESYDYEPFGGSSSSGSPTRQMFQGKERNGDLDYYGARYYDSRQFTAGSSMRWISADSVTSRIYDPPSLNKYTYVRNDPVNKIDPDGRFAIDIVWVLYGDLIDAEPAPFDPLLRDDLASDGGGSSDVGGGEEPGQNDYCSSNETNNRSLSFFASHKADADKIAQASNIPYEVILAVAAEETLWGAEGIFKDTNNWFGLHVNGENDTNHYANQTGTHKATKDGWVAEFAAETGFYDSGMGFTSTRAGQMIKGMTLNTDALEIAGTLHKYGYGEGNQHYVTDFISVLKRVIGTSKCPGR